MRAYTFSFSYGSYFLSSYFFLSSSCLSSFASSGFEPLPVLALSVCLFLLLVFSYFLVFCRVRLFVYFALPSFLRLPIFGRAHTSFGFRVCGYFVGFSAPPPLFFVLSGHVGFRVLGPFWIFGLSLFSSFRFCFSLYFAERSFHLSISVTYETPARRRRKRKEKGGVRETPPVQAASGRVRQSLHKKSTSKRNSRGEG